MHCFEYVKEGKRYVTVIRACAVERQIGDVYVLRCRMHQRGAFRLRVILSEETCRRHVDESSF